MKLTRILPRFVASILVFALMATAAQTNTHNQSANEPTLTAQGQETGTERCTTVTTSGRLVTVFIQGLIVGRYKGGKKKRFEVGIIKRAPGHEFTFNVYAGGTECYPIVIPKKTNWIFQVKRGSELVPRNIRMWPPQGSRLQENNTSQKRIPELEDSNYILNMEGDKLHNGKVDRYKKSFNRCFHFYHGDIISEVVTVPLQAKKVDADQVGGTWKDIGPIAEVVGVEILLNPGEQLVLSKEDGSCVLWQNNYSATGEVEGRILNLPSHNWHRLDYCKTGYRNYAQECPPGLQHCELDLSQFLQLFSAQNKGQIVPQSEDDDDVKPTDFQQYYYLVFQKDRPDRFELKNPRYPTFLCQPEQKTPGPFCIFIVGKDDKGKKVVITTAPPYMCGMALVRSNSDGITF